MDSRKQSFALYWMLSQVSFDGWASPYIPRRKNEVSIIIHTAGQGKIWPLYALDTVHTQSVCRHDHGVLLCLGPSHKSSDIVFYETVYVNSRRLGLFCGSQASSWLSGAAFLFLGRNRGKAKLDFSRSEVSLLRSSLGTACIPLQSSPARNPYGCVSSLSTERNCIDC